ncbi:VOC family protein [Halalkalibacter krulwichiae]|uniref:Catechol-2,3-dioxygenase n=1 Tax=Halalkalibacter krulwichiae TaxID=199441 RepID=A0A1X9M9X3_9BACI|nr:VOC family protein [Halalkalibacter krulwichiae]ARK30208.1 Catechol-2,3-dioxygenase [Halalkalibacter krulwichiae]
MSFRIHPELELGPVKLKVSNLERSIQFYKEIIGFKVLNKGEKVVELTANDKDALLILEEVSNALVYPPGTSLGLYHVAILLPERSDLGLFLKHVANKGVKVGSADHFVSEALYLSDPDHNGLEIYRDRPREGWTKYGDDYKMVTEPIDAQGLLQAAGEHDWQGLPEKTTIGHIHLHVRDLYESKNFYRDLLGMDVTVGNMTKYGMLFMAAGGYHHHIGLNIWAGSDAKIRPKNAVGIEYYTILLPDEEALSKVVHHLTDNQVTIIEVDEGWLIEGPSGVGIRLQIKKGGN